MRQAQQTLRARGVELVAVDQQENVGVVAAFAKANAIDYPVYVDDRATSQEVYGVHMLPTLLFFDQRGILRAKVEGPMATAELLSMARRNIGG